MEQFISRLWLFLINLYAVIVHGGFTAVAVAALLGLFFTSYGDKLIGKKATVTGKVRYGELVDGQFHPAVEGTARSFAGRLVGITAQLIGALLLIEAVFAGVGVAMAK